MIFDIHSFILWPQSSKRTSSKFQPNKNTLSTFTDSKKFAICFELLLIWIADYLMSLCNIIEYMFLALNENDWKIKHNSIWYNSEFIFFLKTMIGKILFWNHATFLMINRKNIINSELYQILLCLIFQLFSFNAKNK